jgi:hypothetical protein
VKHRHQTYQLAATLILLSFASALTVQPSSGAIVKAASPALTDVSTAVGLAVAGDTVVIPAGTASWSAPLVINKGITLMGSTVITVGKTPTACSFTDTTIIRDSTTGDCGPIDARSLPACSNSDPLTCQPLRITGVSFLTGNRPQGSGGGAIKINGANQNHIPVRIDNCHISMYQTPNILWMTGLGLIDHCYVDSYDEGIYPSQENWTGVSGGTQSQGDGSWNDYPYYGSGKFLFIEDCYFDGAHNGSTIDNYRGGRVVIRHNVFHNVTLSQYHGTETTQRGRGSRCSEVYENDCFFDSGVAIHNPELRSGGLIEHDNRWHIANTQNQFNGQRINVYRSNGAFNYWNGANGVNVIDNIDGVLYESGVASAGSGNGVLVDSSKNWPANKWVGYAVLNVDRKVVNQSTQGTTNAQGDNYCGTGHTSTANSITFNDGEPDTVTANFQPGDHYEIRKVLLLLDQAGAGKGDLITGGSSSSSTQYNNGLQSGFYNLGQHTHLHQAIEPVMWWGNTQMLTSGSGTGINVPQMIVSSDGPNVTGPFPTSGATYYDLGPSVTGASPSQMTTLYSSALNGVPYTGTYTYPHPLTQPLAPPSNLQIVP